MELAEEGGHGEVPAVGAALRAGEGAGLGGVVPAVGALALPFGVVEEVGGLVVEVLVDLAQSVVQLDGLYVAEPELHRGEARLRDAESRVERERLAEALRRLLLLVVGDGLLYSLHSLLVQASVSSGFIEPIDQTMMKFFLVNA